jgi:uncharacterized protein
MQTQATTQSNKDIITDAMNALARGDSGPFGAAMAEEFSWRPQGVVERWAKSYEGRAEVSAFFRRFWKQFDARMMTTPLTITAEGDRVVVEARGQVMTNRGESYNNRYCYVIEMRDGKMIELREYLDTALADERLDLSLL